ncbi:heavy metal translocating P-type ATPase [Xinfangfangia sp. CPCC 101601]|uniref:Heavy metal translocating P-type ATPase n=1 Tax=Pseudogemmobacter lacusdianii TaxID=3069608 RepID=A0ABU0VW27_9RHOB|nr:heavy metal translocating P-type ATPase [Xinfangfangia sp. CPCC 101601]MDQ2065944.1 heavy metal translocating P-type ATPase [Xinfangfangia sp. CPCC 101601]
MSLAEPDHGSFGGGLSACPACVAAPSAERIAQIRAQKPARIMLSLPAAHCAACISTVEAALARAPGVTSARLNLTQKRALVEAEPQVTPDDLIAVLKSVGYEAYELDAGALSATEADRTARDLLMRLGVAFFSMMNVMLLSVAVWSGADAATRDMFHWLSGAIALPTVIFSGQPFFRSAWASLRVGRVGMDVPISLALILASGISLYETIHSGHHAYFDAAVMLCFFLLIGRYLDYRTRAIARSAAEELAALEVPRSIVLRDGVEVMTPTAEVSPGDLVLVRPGARVPVDGVVTQGTSELDRSLLTGESLPVFAEEGAEVSAGEVNLTGPLVLRVTAAGKDSSLHRMADLVAVAEAAKTRYTSLAERASGYYSSLVHVLSFAALAFWMWQTDGDVRYAVNISAAVLIITCPCALGLAVPAVVTAASGRLFRKGLLIKQGTALERLAEVDTVVFDKTGTLTLGTPEPTNLETHSPRALSLALALAEASSHPLARSLTDAARARGIVPAAVEALREVPGYGIEGHWQGQTLRLGRAAWCGADPALVAETATWLSLGEGAAPLAFTFTDRPRPGADLAVSALIKAGKRVILLSGDAEAAVRATAERLGISEWASGQLPAEKSARVSGLMAEGHRVLMVGDGLNDTAALAAAHVSISPASALDAARVASDIVLLGQDMAPIADAVRISGQASRRIVENFMISGGYNVVAVPLALVGMATPLAAALAMSLSSITVSLNALRLK